MFEVEVENTNATFAFQIHSIPFLVKCINIIHPHAEDEEVFLPGLLGHLNVSPIHGTDG